MEYELVREIFNQCSGNQMRDVFFSTVVTDDPEKYVRDFVKGSDISIEKTVNKDGSIIFDVVSDGLKQRFSFS